MLYKASITTEPLLLPCSPHRRVHHSGIHSLCPRTHDTARWRHQTLQQEPTIDTESQHSQTFTTYAKTWRKNNWRVPVSIGYFIRRSLPVKRNYDHTFVYLSSFITLSVSMSWQVISTCHNPSIIVISPALTRPFTYHLLGWQQTIVRIDLYDVCSCHLGAVFWQRPQVSFY